MRSPNKQAGLAKNAFIAIIAVLAIIAAGIYYATRPEPTADQTASGQNEKAATDDKMPAPSEVEGMEGDHAMEDKSGATTTTPGEVMKESDKTMMDGQEMMTPEIKTFNLTGRNFAFSQTEIRVKKGDKVVINFEATEGFHDWTVEGYGVGTKSVAVGQKTSVSFTADQAGTFEYYCSVGSHRAAGMVGKLIVE